MDYFLLISFTFIKGKRSKDTFQFFICKNKKITHAIISCSASQFCLTSFWFIIEDPNNLSHSKSSSENYSNALSKMKDKF